jgi:3'(2'), 5'-bisphosphate nucleotidase
MDSQCKYGLVARGDASLYLRIPAQNFYVEAIWDHAAGSIIVEEAGGRVTDLQGKVLDFSTGRKLAKNRGIIATNGQFHDQVLEAVRESSN